MDIPPETQTEREPVSSVSKLPAASSLDRETFHAKSAKMSTWLFRHSILSFTSHPFRSGGLGRRNPGTEGE